MSAKRNVRRQYFSTRISRLKHTNGQSKTTNKKEHEDLKTTMASWLKFSPVVFLFFFFPYVPYSRAIMRFSYTDFTRDSNLLCLVSDTQVAYERFYLK